MLNWFFNNLLKCCGIWAHFPPIPRDLTHEEAQIYHSRIRARERYDLNLNDKLYHIFTRFILTNHESVEKINRNIGTNELWRIRHDRKDFYVVFDVNTKQIATFLPLENEHVKYAMSIPHRVKPQKAVIKPRARGRSFTHRDLTKVAKDIRDGKRRGWHDELE